MSKEVWLCKIPAAPPFLFQDFWNFVYFYYIYLSTEDNVFILSEAIEYNEWFLSALKPDFWISISLALGYLHDLETSLCFRFSICYKVGMVVYYKVIVKIKLIIIIPGTNIGC